MAMQNLPWAAVYSRALREGSLPLWVPEMWCGFPLFADGQVGALYPLNVVLFMALPYDIALHYGLVLHYVLIALFSFWLAREMGSSRPAGFLAGGLLALSGPLVVHAIHVNMVRTLAWLPLSLVLVSKAQRSAKPLLFAPALSIVFAVQALGGNPPALLISAAAVALAALLLPARERMLSGGRGPAASSARSPASALRMVALVAVSAVVGAALAGVQLLPTMELARLSERAQRRGSLEFLTFGHIPLQFLPTLIFPRLMGSLENRTFAAAAWQFHEWCAYVGLLPLILAAAGWRTLDKGWRRALAAMAVTGLVLGLAQWPYYLLRYLPAANLLRVPTRWLLLFDVAVIMAAATGFDALLRGERRVVKRTAAWCAALGGAMLLVATAGLAGGAAGFRWIIESPGSGRARDLLQYCREQEIWLVACILALAAAALAASLRRRLSVATAAGVVGILCILDLLRFGYDYNPLVSPRELMRQPPIVDALRRDGMEGRVCQPLPSGPGGDVRSATRSWPYVEEQIALLRPNHNLRWGVPHVIGYSTLGTSQHAALGSALALGLRTRSTRVLEIASVGYWADSGAGRSSARLQGQPQVRVIRMSAPMARAYLVGAAVPASNYAAALAQALSESFDPRAAVALETVPDQPLHAEGPLREASARIARETTTTVEIECRTPSRAVLVLTDMFYPGWVATVDGRPARIYRANGLFRAVAVERGGHRVVFRYRPVSVRAGMVLSLLTLIALAVNAARQRRTARAT